MAAQKRQRDKSTYWRSIILRIRGGEGLDLAVSHTPWVAAKWRKWIDMREERQEQLNDAERIGISAMQASLQARAVACYDAWLKSVECAIAEGKPVNKDNVKELRLLMETKMKDLRPTKLKPEDARVDADGEWD